MTEQELDRLMCRILWDAAKSDDAYRSSSASTFQASSRHQSQMRAMLKEPLHWARQRSRPLWKQILQHVAVAVLTLAISLAAVMAASPTVRAAVVQWIVEQYETHMVYRHLGDVLVGEMPHYEIGSLPEGYAETERMVADAAVNVLYEDGKGGIVCLDYTHLHEGGFSILTAEDDDVFDVSVNHAQGKLFVPRDPEAMLTLTWIDEDANIQFMLLADLDETAMVRLAESVQIKK